MENEDQMYFLSLNQEQNIRVKFSGESIHKAVTVDGCHLL